MLRVLCLALLPLARAQWCATQVFGPATAGDCAATTCPASHPTKTCCSSLNCLNTTGNDEGAAVLNIYACTCCNAQNNCIFPPNACPNGSSDCSTYVGALRVCENGQCGVTKVGLAQTAFCADDSSFCFGQGAVCQDQACTMQPAQASCENCPVDKPNCVASISAQQSINLNILLPLGAPLCCADKTLAGCIAAPAPAPTPPPPAPHTHSAGALASPAWEVSLAAAAALLL